MVAGINLALIRFGNSLRGWGDGAPDGHPTSYWAALPAVVYFGLLAAAGYAQDRKDVGVGLFIILAHLLLFAGSIFASGVENGIFLAVVTCVISLPAILAAVSERADEMKKEPNQAPEPTAPSGRGSS